ncbi:MAG: hypothetical protein P1U32_09185 [Legionellaceae bacterium]|nr:hypothetical protein [Legionellaceae bacterium]
MFSHARALKKIVSALISIITRKSFSANEFVLYKIVDSYPKGGVEYFKIQCINTKAVFDMKLQEIVFDLDILYGLHPVQGCYIGIEYATNMKELGGHERPKTIFNKYSACRYGTNNLLYQNRNGLLGFECKRTGEQFVLDPRDIALSKECIEAFDAVQAFCIGVLAGIKFLSTKDKPTAPVTAQAPHLRLIKNDD